MSKTYLAKLRATSDEANLRHEEAKTQRHADPRVLCDQPLSEQIESLMRSLSPAQRDHPWSMEELVSRLQGRYSDRSHSMNVGQALRALGWTQRRKWRAGAEGRRVWLLPNAD